MHVPEVETPPPGAAYLVSFPRTGSHWLRMVLELYFDRPLLRRHFFEHDNEDYLLWHTHDRDGALRDPRDTVYLYRSVVNTVFSEVSYRHGEAAPDQTEGVVDAIAAEYRAHLRRWLVDGGSGGRVHPVAYEWLLDRPGEALRGVIEFLGGSYDGARAGGCWERVTHDAVREKNEWNSRVVRDDHGYQLRRDLFRYRHGRRIVAAFEADRELIARIDDRLLA